MSVANELYSSLNVQAEVEIFCFNRLNLMHKHVESDI